MVMKRIANLFPAAACLALLGGGAAYAQGSLASSPSQVGKSVSNICFSSTINRWSAVKGQDGAILLDRAANDWYYVTLNSGCSEKLIAKANMILVESKPGSGCLSKGDTITIQQFGGAEYPCTIRGINEWDHHAPDEQGKAGD